MVRHPVKLFISEYYYIKEQLAQPQPSLQFVGDPELLSLMAGGMPLADYVAYTARLVKHGSSGLGSAFNRQAFFLTTASVDEMRYKSDAVFQEAAVKLNKMDFVGVMEDMPKPRATFILNRGNYLKPGAEVPMAVPASLAVQAEQSPADRLSLARWLVAPENPLTARVAVNRIWLHLFGRGLVPSADDFGLGGHRPTHPELLDYLARKFQAGGGSTKSLIRELVLSRTYRLSSEADLECQAIDPDDELLWRARPRRLDAESIRDAMLSAAGTLDPRPLRGSLVAQIGDPQDNARPLMSRPGVERASENMNRRSLYLPVIRDTVADVLDVFDFAEPSLVVTQRDETLVPAQTLFLMNSPFSRDQAQAFGQRLLRQAGGDAARIRQAYRWAFARDPAPQEAARALEFIRSETLARDTRTGRPAGRDEAWTLFAQALFACAEFRYLP
jgi:hypothetical protein